MHLFQKNLQQIGFFLLMSLLLGLTYTQEPLFFAHQYYIHGLAKAGYGILHKDWIASTLDAFPLFSAIVTITHKYFFDGFFYIYHMLLLGVYAVGMISIADSLFKIRSSRTSFLLFLGAFIGIHSMLWMIFTKEMGNVLYNGVANFYLLGPIFQPALFGVFLITSIALFLRGNIKTAVLIAGLVPWMHPTYLLSSGALMAAYFLTNIRRRSFHDSLEMIALGVMTLAPPAVFSLLTVGFATRPELMKQAQDILVNIRIPHHALPSAALSHPFERIIFVAVAIWMMRKTKMMLILLVPLVICIALSLLAIFTGSETLDLLFPWRLSVFLVPLSLTIYLAWISRYLPAKFHDDIYRWAFEGLSIIAIVASVSYGGWLMAPYLQKNYNPKSNEYKGIVQFVRQNLLTNDVYLIPPKNKEFMFFRLQTTAPIYVDWKSHPFGDKDIVEWYRRYQEAQSLYEPYTTMNCDLIKKLKTKYHLTRMVLWKDNPTNDPVCPGMQFMYGNEMYSIVGLQ